MLEDKGPEYLETYRVPLLSWQGVKSLKGPETIGLPLTAGGDGDEQAGKAERRVAGLLEGGPPATGGHHSERSIDARQPAPGPRQHDDGLTAIIPDRPVLDALD